MIIPKLTFISCLTVGWKSIKCLWFRLICLDIFKSPTIELFRPARCLSDKDSPVFFFYFFLLPSFSFRMSWTHSPIGCLHPPPTLRGIVTSEVACCLKLKLRFRFTWRERGGILGGERGWPCSNLVLKTMWKSRVTWCRSLFFRNKRGWLLR